MEEHQAQTIYYHGQVIWEADLSFEDMKKHSGKRFKEITKMLREEDKKRREKKEQRKEMDARDDG